ncbi:ADP-ribose pyrophosphatase YjhB, NUDIX family [Loktanella fryxellensis]|uniref:ADP-ribose pyrophosphatase YjhB, NUDIX family n=1 Tax=Loktanella fryxellensis TaxID=245187 RepID=A0A1H8D9J9_9RHOB|nr:NUDIX hydrolase [Loktanella fryxellensis]SEN03942.1 ADP-ribose pyrophosphatase YjhB, NUDIX family [Loktanella fryxellensis]
MSRPPRLAVRAVIVHDDRLLLVNAYAGRTDLWCAPGGGVEAHASLTDNLRREMYEETGLQVRIGPVCLVNEFHDPDRDMHQVDIYFRCTVDDPAIAGGWADPEGIVSHHCWVTRADLSGMVVKPDSLAGVAWDDGGAMTYDPLEPILR